ncbi:hypothetical protein GCM10010363_15580 [Streptomyces omiyaensis]|nr:hypothetical protein GCM10010363_15580 [Streptomyces omiyaensis]
MRDLLARDPPGGAEAGADRVRDGGEGGPVGTVAALGVTVPAGVPPDRVAAAVRAAATRARPPVPPPSP